MLADISTFEALQENANKAMGCGGLGVFNDVPVDSVENGSGGQQALFRKMEELGK